MIKKADKVEDIKSVPEEVAKKVHKSTSNGAGGYDSEGRRVCD